MEHSEIEKHVNRINQETSYPISLDILKTNCIVSSKQLIFEIENLEDKILDLTERNINELLITGAKLYLLLEEVKKL